MIHLDGYISSNDFTQLPSRHAGEQSLLEQIFDRLPEDMQGRVRQNIRSGEQSDDSFSLRLTASDADWIFSHIQGDDEVSTVLRQEAALVLAADENAMNLFHGIVDQLEANGYAILESGTIEDGPPYVTFTRGSRTFFCTSFSPRTSTFLTLGQGTVRANGSISYAQTVAQSDLDHLALLVRSVATSINVEVRQEPSPPPTIRFSTLIGESGR